MLRDEYAYTRNERGNWYHQKHRPGNVYIDARTARVLIDNGLAEITRFGRLVLTGKGWRA
jgi:hypothetical protein